MLKKIFSAIAGSTPVFDKAGDSRLSGDNSAARIEEPEDSILISTGNGGTTEVSEADHAKDASSREASVKAAGAKSSVKPFIKASRENGAPVALFQEAGTRAVNLPPVCRDVETAESIPLDKGILTSGEPFSEVDANSIKAIFGEPVTRSGLSRVYSNCVPGARVCIPFMKKTDDNTLDYTVSWMDNNGREVSHLDRRMSRNPDGSLDLHSYNVWVEPDYRGRGTSARVLLNEEQLLRTLSTNPDTRLTLRAGHATIGWKTSEKLGTYTWANFGFDFAKNYPYKTGFESMGYTPSEGKGEMSDLECMKEKFREWVGEKAKQDVLISGLEEGLVQMSKIWKHPWEISNFRIPGVKVNCNIGGQDVPCDLGKAFLVSEEAPFWNGAIYVNRADSPGLEIGHKYCEKTLSRARAELEKERHDIAEALHSNNEEKELQAIKRIGVEGGIEDLWALDKSQHSGKVSRRLLSALESGRKSVRGEALESGLCGIILDRDQPAAARSQAYLRLRNITGETNLDLVNSLLSEPGNELRLSVLSSLYWTEWSRNPGMVADMAARLLENVKPDPGDENVCCLRKWIYSILAFSDGNRYAKTLYQAAAGEEREDIVGHIRGLLQNIASEESGKYLAALDSAPGGVKK